MKIKLCGAAGEVTGSSYLMQTDRARVLIDCGMFQGSRDSDDKNASPDLIELMQPSLLNSVVLTHAHLDHCGRLPLLARHGFRGHIYCTAATRDVAALILYDSAHIQESDAERENKFRERSGEPFVEPLYTSADVDAIVRQFVTLPLERPKEVAPGVTARFVEAGHILGSASVEFTVTESDAPSKTIVFSGDIGPRNMPLLNDYTNLSKADMVFLESTYGDRDHRPMDQTIQEFQAILKQCAWNKSKVLIPSFAVGRSQQILYHLAQLRRAGAVPEVPIYLDSPMANKATEMYKTHASLLDSEAKAMGFRGDFHKLLPEFHAVSDSRDSQALNKLWDSAIIIASSGMCEGGRIVHHLKHNLWRKGVAVVLVGYMGQGTLGRRLVERQPKVRIHGREIIVRATIHTLGGFSAHAGQSDLIHWFSTLAHSKPKLVLTHGEEAPRTALAKEIHHRYGIQAQLPRLGDVVEV